MVAFKSDFKPNSPLVEINQSSTSRNKGLQSTKYGNKGL